MNLIILLRLLMAGLIGMSSGTSTSYTLAGDGDVQFPLAATDIADIDFGDDASDWANDGECDDKRFTGPGMTLTVLLDSDIGHDASDCRAAFEAGQLTVFVPATADIIIDGINFGDDSGDWTNDQQCDDPRFAGAGMASILTPADIRRDASDCAAAWQAGTIRLAEDGDDDDSDDTTGITEDWIEDGINFGTDSSPWSNDGECDDPRFSGPGMTVTSLLDSDIRADASDCLAAWRAGTLTLSDGGEKPAMNSSVPSPAVGTKSIAN